VYFESIVLTVEPHTRRFDSLLADHEIFKVYSRRPGRLLYRLFAQRIRRKQLSTCTRSSDQNRTPIIHAIAIFDRQNETPCNLSFFFLQNMYEKFSCASYFCLATF